MIIGFQSDALAKRPQSVQIGDIRVEAFSWNSAPAMDPESSGNQLGEDLAQFLTRASYQSQGLIALGL